MTQLTNRERAENILCGGMCEAGLPHKIACYVPHNEAIINRLTQALDQKDTEARKMVERVRLAARELDEARGLSRANGMSAEAAVLAAFDPAACLAADGEGKKV